MSNSKKTQDEGETLALAVAEEESLLTQVREALSGQVRHSEVVDYDADLLALRDALAEERLADDRAMLLDQMDRMAALSAARERRTPSWVDPDSPYFAHLRIAPEEEAPRDIMLGRRTYVRGGVRIVDWRHAPISRVFYRYREGEWFAEDIADRQMEGEVLARRTVTVVDGELLRVATPAGTYFKTSHGWRDVTAAGASLAGGAGTSTRPDTAQPVLGGVHGGFLRGDKHLPEIASLLDPEQFELLTRRGDELLVVAGGAGSGKTTVGLHRLAFLTYEDVQRYRPQRMAVFVFGRALARYISQVLPALGVEGVPVYTLGEWALSQRLRHFPDLTRHVSERTPAVVVRFKTHRILAPMLAEAAARYRGAEPARVFDELFSDRQWLADGVTRFAPGAFSADEIAQVHRWCADMHFRRVDPDDEGEGEPPAYDEEDSMILLRLQQLLRGRLLFRGRRKLTFDHLMIDEVQDFSPLELLVLLDTVRDGSVTLSGDPAQRITDNDFSDWSEALDLIGQPHVQVRPLRVSYRSTQPIMEAAQAVLGPLAPTEPPQAQRGGAPVEMLRFGGQGQALTFLGDALADLVAREPMASVAVLSRTAQQADEAWSVLRRTNVPRLRRVADQDFTFGPGVEITDVAQTKGLEFDYVVLLDVDRQSYPATPAARHLLHVGMTRAMHQLWLVCWSPPSQILPPNLKVTFGG